MILTSARLQTPAAGSAPARPRRNIVPAARLAAVAPPVLQPQRAPRQLCLDLQPRLR
jgi:hypothetical protein